MPRTSTSSAWLSAAVETQPCSQTQRRWPVAQALVVRAKRPSASTAFCTRGMISLSYR